MSQARNHLPAVSPTGTSHQHAVVTNQLVKLYNRLDADMFPPIYAADTGTATAYAMTPTPGIKFYVVGQTFIFKASHANSGTTPTLNVNGFGAGTITKQNGAALAVGDIASGDFVSVICTSTTPTFELQSPGAAAPTGLPGTAIVASGTSWTPTDASGASLTFTSVSASYQQIGNLVFAFARLTYPSTVNASAAKIGGLPVGVPNQTYANGGQATFYANGATGGGMIVPIINSSTSALVTANGAPIANSSFSTFTLSFLLIYPVS